MLIITPTLIILFLYGLVYIILSLVFHYFLHHDTIITHKTEFNL